ncbi:helix-turn-helix transcriptional regulator [Microbispora cellulosiformans]|uniref:Helix-turn-helix transcriptional regulator n=1 Tax=Microbispora cellulosiformans TaxID=2614688 RepID=A0A5J5K5Z5_9ACTN|nr:helix-turn-helix transcriptional regulator [Microbispora cellulosiformans]KAA9379717.1 helix-turn-helix transcriptional regulator [Microbispora cellulosiformans]
MRDTTPTIQSNGDRLRKLRLAKGWSRDQLAAAADGISIHTIQAYEQGRRGLENWHTITLLADALGCHPTQITGAPYPVAPSDRDGQVASSAMPALHRALLCHGRPGQITAAEADAVDLQVLAARVGKATELRQRAALARSGELLPQLVRDLQVAVAVLAAGPDRRAAYDLLASAYECVMQVAYKLGHISTATLATERVVWSALETGDPLRVMASRWYEAGEYIAVGEHQVAADIIDGALVELDEYGSRTPQAVSLRGAMHLKMALNAARAADRPQAEASWRSAMEVAEQLGEDRNDYQLMFGPTNTLIWGVTVPIEFGDGREAIKRAERVRIPKGYSKERAGHFHMDVGRAYFYAGNRDRALAAFLQAEQVAPQQTRMHPGVRETLTTMIRTARPGALHQLAVRAGVI